MYDASMLSSGEWDRQLALEAEEEDGTERAEAGPADSGETGPAGTLADLLSAFLPRSASDRDWDEDLVDLEDEDERPA